MLMSGSLPGPRVSEEDRMLMIRLKREEGGVSRPLHCLEGYLPNWDASKLTAAVVRSILYHCSESLESVPSLCRPKTISYTLAIKLWGSRVDCLSKAGARYSKYTGSPSCLSGFPFSI